MRFIQFIRKLIELGKEKVPNTKGMSKEEKEIALEPFIKEGRILYKAWLNGEEYTEEKED